MTLRDKVLHLVGTWSSPPDFPAKVALGVAVVFAAFALFGGGRPLLGGQAHTHGDAEKSRRHFLAIVGLAAALLSIAYISSYLRGGPRIVDATTYFLQGRALSHGDLSWTPIDPSAAFRGRFLLYREGAGGPSLGGIFPPGYPLLLAIGFTLGAPMIVGPVLAALLVTATHRLAREVAEETFPELAEPIARAAALLSLLCAALRYHTADTMSHGATALGVTVALTCALRSRRAPRPELHEPLPFHDGRGWASLAGLAVGYVVATRPVSAVPIAIVVGWIVLQGATAKRTHRVFYVLACALPGLFLLLLSQRAVTGAWLASTQRMYYALSDGPAGCFRWGFGKGTGCVFEHGDFVEARLSSGYGFTEALGTTLRRLRAHVLDIANLEPLAVLVLVPFVWRSKTRGKLGVVGPLGALVALQILVYLPFYFDGDYPGGGARFFADVLPVEHVLTTLGIACILGHTTGVRSFSRSVFATLSLMALGFAIHDSYEHGMLRDRDGGRPMFEPDVLARASISKGLVFVDTDHGFALGHDPAVRPTDGVMIARRRNDDRDRMLFDTLGRPPTYLYELRPASQDNPSIPTVTPWTPPESSLSLRFEAEAEWPPLSQEGGFALPLWVSGCASQRRSLVLTPERVDAPAHASFAVPVPSAGTWMVTVAISNDRHAKAFPKIESRTTSEGSLELGGTRWAWRSDVGECAVLTAKAVDLVPPRAVVTIEAIRGPIGVDFVSLTKAADARKGPAEGSGSFGTR